MLASATDRLPGGDDWTYELKLDGYRIIADLREPPVHLWSRRGQDYSERFGEVAAALPAAVEAPCVLDGEVCALDDQGRSRFSLLQSGEGTLVFFCFDLLELEGRDVTGLPLSERRALLSEVVTAGPVVRVSHSYDDGAALLEQAKQMGLEGVMMKRPRSVYRPGQRSKEWLKLKLKQRDSFVIAGYTAGTGSRSSFGALVLAERTAGGLEWRGDVGTGFSGDEVERLLARLEPLVQTAKNVVRTRPGSGDVGHARAELRGGVRRAHRCRTAARAGLRAPRGRCAAAAPRHAHPRFTRPPTPTRSSFPSSASPSRH